MAFCQRLRNFFIGQFDHKKKIRNIGYEIHFQNYFIFCSFPYEYPKEFGTFYLRSSLLLLFKIPNIWPLCKKRMLSSLSKVNTAQCKANAWN